MAFDKPQTSNIFPFPWVIDNPVPEFWFLANH